MGLPEVPAICDNCGAVFGSGIVLEGRGSAHMVGNRAGPCPVCGAWGTIPDGLYEFVGSTLAIVSKWTPHHRQSFAGELERAKASPTPRPAAEAVIRKQPDLLPVAQRLLIPRNAGEFWAFIATLLAAIALLGSEAGPDVTVNEKTVIEEVIAQPEPSKPRANRRGTGRPADQEAKARARRKAARQARRQGRRR
jgi:hypothetical protein